jgi:TolB-like protein
MKGRRIRPSSLAAPAPGFVAALVILCAPALSPAQGAAPLQTLCVLDFQRLGDDARSDWLQQGLADLMIGTMASVSPYLVIERTHLREMLAEQGLASSGLLDVETAVRGAGLARAQSILQGSFARHGDRLTIQARLVRVTDQRVVAQATWTGRYTDVLSAPRALSHELLAPSERPVDGGMPAGIELLFPPTVDGARSYYLGVGAFDAGRYPESLAHYLDAARGPGDFRKAHTAVLEMYYLLGMSEHAVLYARDLARAYEAAGEVPASIEYYFLAAREALGPLNDQRSGRDLLQRLLNLVARYDEKTGDMARTRRAVLDRLAELRSTGRSESAGGLLTDRDIRHQVWTGDIEAELARRSEERARGGIAVLEDGRWVKQPVPAPTMLMWKIRALGALGRACARLGDIRAALDQYQQLLREYEFLHDYLPADGRLLAAIRTEAHFLLLHHYATSGRLIRDHAINRINRLNVVSGTHAFTRDFRTGRIDERARTASRHDGRAYEYFDFAAPSGYQIDSVTLRATVEGLAEFAVDVPQPAGWPPRYTFSKRLTRFRFSRRGAHERTVVPPPASEFVSLATSWGPGLASNTRADVQRRGLNQPAGGQDIVRWEATFSLSPTRGPAEAMTGAGVESPLTPDVRSVIARYSSGWEHASVVRAAQTLVYSGTPRLDAYAEDWLAYSLDGEIRIFNQRDPALEVGMPITINSREREFDPSLVRTHDGRYALLFARGTGRTNARRFVAFSADLLRWDTPHRLRFADPAAATGYTYARAEPLERTYNVAAASRGYVMLLAQGFLRHSDDLEHWSAPYKALPQDLEKNRLVRGHDGTIWVVYETTSPERQDHRDDNWLSGFFVVGGKRYTHMTELRVSRSIDGRTWLPAGTVTLSGQPSALWSFNAGERQIGIGVGFNNVHARWFSVSTAGVLRESGAELPVMYHSEDAQFFVRGARLTCIRPVVDPATQSPMLLATTTERVWGGARRK